MDNKKLREILTVLCLAVWTASMDWPIATGILMGVTLAIIRYTSWEKS